MILNRLGSVEEKRKEWSERGKEGRKGTEGEKMRRQGEGGRREG